MDLNTLALLAIGGFLLWPSIEPWFRTADGRYSLREPLDGPREASSAQCREKLIAALQCLPKEKNAERQMLAGLVTESLLQDQ